MLRFLTLMYVFAATINALPAGYNLDGDSLAVTKTDKAALRSAIDKARAADKATPLKGSESGCKDYFFFIKGQCGDKTVFDDPYKWIDERGLGKEVISPQELSFGHFLQDAGNEVMKNLIFGGVLSFVKSVSTYHKIEKTLLEYAGQIKDYFAYYAITYAKIGATFEEAAAPSKFSVIASRVWNFLKKVYGSEEFEVLKNVWTVGSVAERQISFSRYLESTIDRLKKWQSLADARYNQLMEQVNLHIGAAVDIANKKALLHAMEKLQAANQLMDKEFGKMGR